MSKVLGIIGGLGPLATAYYYELITNMTDVERDQDHIEIWIHSVPQIPDRTSYIVGASDENPLPELIKTGSKLVDLGADCIAMPCITAHYFHQDLVAGIHAPVIHLVEETVEYLRSRGIERVGIMATDGTVRSGLFQQELERRGLKAIVPEPEFQKDVMHLIYENIKIGSIPEMDRFERVAEHLRSGGAQVIILGCTELSLIKRDQKIGAGFLDAMEVLAVRAIEMCEGKLKEDYKELITKAC